MSDTEDYDVAVEAINAKAEEALRNVHTASEQQDERGVDWQDYAVAGFRLEDVRGDEEPTLHTITTQGHQLAVTTTEEEAVATVETYQRAGYPDLDVVTAGADDGDELSPAQLADENRAADWIRDHDGEPAEGARPDPDSEFVWKDGALQYDGPRAELDPDVYPPAAVEEERERLGASDGHTAAEGETVGTDAAFYLKVGDLEKNDPEIGMLSDQIRAAEEDGRDTDRLNGEFERAVLQKLGPPNEVSKDDLDAEHGDEERASVSSYFTDAELADVDPNFSYGPAGEPRTRADASSEWVTDPDWDGADPFAEAYREPSAEVWEQWEKADAARGAEEPTLHGPYVSPAQSDAAWDAAMAEHGVTFTSERPAELDDQVAQAREALGQLADDSPSPERAPAPSTSVDTDARER